MPIADVVGLRQEVLATLDAARSEAAALDVEALREAMDVVVPESIPPLYWTNERLGVAIATEYARIIAERGRSTQEETR